MKLTVVMRDDSPMIHCGDCPSYRTVVLDLTPLQQVALTPRKTGSSGGVDMYESVSRCILEGVPEYRAKSHSTPTEGES